MYYLFHTNHITLPILWFLTQGKIGPLATANLWIGYWEAFYGLVEFSLSWPPKKGVQEKNSIRYRRLGGHNWNCCWLWCFCKTCLPWSTSSIISLMNLKEGDYSKRRSPQRLFQFNILLGVWDISRWLQTVWVSSKVATKQSSTSHFLIKFAAKGNLDAVEWGESRFTRISNFALWSFSMGSLSYWTLETYR